MSQAAPNQNRPTRPPQSHRGPAPSGASSSAAGSDPLSGRKRANDTNDEERPFKREHQEGGQQQQSNRGGGRGGQRGGMRGGRGGGQQQPGGQRQQQVPQQQIPHPGQQQQQQRPQSAAPFGNGQQQPQPQRNGGGRGGRGQNGGGQRRDRPQPSASPISDDTEMEDVASPAPAYASASSGAHVPSAAGDSVIQSFKTAETFRGLGLSALTQRSMDEEFRYETMSIVQAKCIPTALAGKDIVAKAKTGTGKTIAFLIPVVERILAKRSTLPPAPNGVKPVRALVISPTRELAQQIEDEARRLGKFHGIHLACVVGGLAIGKDTKALAGGLDLLIATPGRLKDLMQNYNGVQAQLNCISMLVLDEADRLLDMGFKPDLDAIFALLPRAEQRQTQLFSATFPPNVADLTSRTLKRDHAVISCVGDDEDQTHQHVKQESVIVPLAQQFEALYELIAQHKAANPNYKIIVFFTTARVASFASRLFNQANCPTLELHSRLSQSKRTKTSEQFRDGARQVLFSSDVSARGLDFPGVSLIIQLGLTAADQYVHRLGRTARAGQEGHGIIVLAPFESRFLQTLTRTLPIVPLALPAGSTIAALAAGQAPAYPPAMRKGNFAHPLLFALSLVEGDGSAASSNDEESLKGEAESAYRAWLGFYNGNLRTCGWDKETLVATANEWSAHIGLREVPTIEAKTIGKMGLKGTRGLRIGQSQQGGGGRGGGGRGGGQQQGGGGRGGYGVGGQGRGGYGGGQGRPQSARY